ncbi:lanthionine synthetase C family protein [Nocardia sp. NPDC049149]|uniref:lanthionine synthetase C family protein n=1 Tax=Nocardia sp. NPDC049149 TaxID=3364315 RepID=UPI00371FF0D4
MTWTRVLPAATAAQAAEVARAVGGRLAAPDSLPPMPHRPTRLRDGASGAVGCAVLLGQFPGDTWELAAQRCLATAVHDIEQDEAHHPGLFDGLAGLAFATWTLSRGGIRYQRLLAHLDHLVNREALARAQAMTQQPQGLPFETFDIISGLTGIGAYLLRRNTNPTALRTVLTGLVALCHWDGETPNWHTPSSYLEPGSPLAQSLPDGLLNCGLAHGIPGPLALLALAELAGISVAGQRESIETVARWLVQQRVDDEHGPNWPKAVDLSGSAAGSRNAWCYGGPGVARTLWLAGTAIDDAGLRDLALGAMFAALRRISDTEASPDLCHGVAGLLQITVRFAQDTSDPRFVMAAADLTHRLLDLYHPGYRFGFRCTDTAPQDRPGLLDGAAGPALALLAAATDVPPQWDRMLLLA